MSRWIDVDKLHEQMQWCIEHDMYDKPFDYIAEIYEAPSIDICFCKECKHWHNVDSITYCDRIDYGYGYKADDFCSYGERGD